MRERFDVAGRVVSKAKRQPELSALACILVVAGVISAFRPSYQNCITAKGEDTPVMTYDQGSLVSAVGDALDACWDSRRSEVMPRFTEAMVLFTHAAREEAQCKFAAEPRTGSTIPKWVTVGDHEGCQRLAGTFTAYQVDAVDFPVAERDLTTSKESDVAVASAQ